MKGSALFVVLIATLVLSFSARASQTSAIEVHADQEIGPLPFLFRSGMFAWGAESVYPDYLQQKFFQEHKPGAVEVSSDNILYDSQSFEDIVTRLHAQPEFDAFLKRVQDHGGKVVIGLFGMPRWLSSNPDDTRPVEPGEWMAVWGASPPKDYEQWAQVVETIVDYYSNQLGLDASYKVWWEPDGVRWQGTEEEFFELYRYTIIGARRVTQSAEVGGPSPASWNSIFWRDHDEPQKEPMLYNFIRYCANTAVPEVGLDRVPIDFLVWHQFHSESARGFQQAASEIRTWLKAFGYPETIPMLIGEWTTWRGPGELSAERDTEYTAAYAIAALIGMHEAGITHHAFTSMVEQEPANYKGEFGGDFGIFTKSLLIKPVYNAFRTLSYLGEEQLKVEVADPFLAAVGTRDTDSVVLLIANFIPDGKMMRQSLEWLLGEMGYTRQDIATYGLTREMLKQLPREFRQRDQMDARAHGLPARVQPALDDAAALAKHAFMRGKEAVAVDVYFQHLPSDLVHYERYIIDATHSNSHAVWDQIEADVATPIEEINEWPEVRLQKVEEKAIRPTGEYRETLSLSPYSVTLIRLSR